MRSFKNGVVCDRCLGMLGVRSFKIRVVCDRCLGMLGCDRCLGMLGCDCLKLGLCAIAVWGCWECDRLKLGLCAIAVGMLGVRSFKNGVVCDSEALPRNRLKLG